NSRHSSVDSMVGQIDLSGTFATGAIGHSFSAGFEASWEQSKRGNYSVNTSPRCVNSGPGATGMDEVGAGSNYNCTDLFDPDPFDPWVNYEADGVTPTPIAKSPITGITEATTYALYAADTITLTDALLLNLGLRYDWYDT